MSAMANAASVIVKRTVEPRMKADARHQPGRDDPARPWYRRHPAALFLGALGLAVVSSPFTEKLESSELAEVVRLTLVLLTGLLALSRRHRLLILGVIIVLPAVVGKWLNHWQPDLVPDWTFQMPGVLFVLFVLLQLLRFILRAPHVNSEVLCAGIAGYLLLGFLWALAYTLVAQLDPAAFVFASGPAGQSMKTFTALYFSFVTLSTVGYGDIAAASNPARMLAMVEAVIGLFYSTILIARLVSLYSSEPPKVGPSDPQGL